jgi:hypothetical protein
MGNVAFRSGGPTKLLIKYCWKGAATEQPGGKGREGAQVNQTLPEGNS